ncbi:MAG: GPP34 family phosphoprotein [Gammaproteobacteria bacterium]|jgi:hypothetical protein
MRFERWPMHGRGFTLILMFLHEEILLLALRDDTGKVDSKAANFRTAMASAILAERLLAKRIETSSGRLIFDTISFPGLDPEPERKMIERLKQAVFDDDGEVDARTTVLISLASAAGMLSIPFTRKELRERKNRIAEITRGNLLGEATSDVIQATQAALMAAAIIPAIATTTTSSAGSPGS